MEEIQVQHKIVDQMNTNTMTSSNDQIADNML
jgi:hypothetical protein